MIYRLLRVIQNLRKGKAITKYILHINTPRIAKQAHERICGISVPFSVILALAYNLDDAKSIEDFLKHFRLDLVADLGMVAYLVELYLETKEKYHTNLKSGFIRLFEKIYRLLMELDVAVCRMVYPSWLLVANYVKADRILRSAKFDDEEAVLRDLLEYVRDLFGWYVRRLLAEELLSLRLDPFFVVFAMRVIPEEYMEKLKRIYGAEVVDAAINDYVQQARRLLQGYGDLDADTLEVLKILYRELTADVGYA